MRTLGLLQCHTTSNGPFTIHAFPTTANDQISSRFVPPKYCKEVTAPVEDGMTAVVVLIKPLSQFWSACLPFNNAMLPLEVRTTLQYAFVPHPLAVEYC